MEDIQANYLVMTEIDKSSYDFKEILRKHNIFYCHLDNFKTPYDNKFFKIVFKKEVQSKLDEAFNNARINAKQLFNTALRESRAEISKQEQLMVFNRFIKSLQIDVDDNDNFVITTKM